MADIKDISKIKLANGEVVTIKDAQGRTNLKTLLGGHALEALGAAAWRGITTSVSDETAGVIADAAAVKAYVDAQVGSIHKFDVKIYDTLPTASAETMYILALVAEEGSTDSYVEYITVRSGTEGAYTYAWERIGTTQTDLADYVKKTTKIAGIDLQDDIEADELQEALGLEDLAYADTASGSTTLETIDDITMKAMIVAGNATVTSSDADAELTRIAYTPAGSITGKAIMGGSINVTLKDAEDAEEAELTKSTFTPAGTVAAVENGSFTALKSAAMVESDSESAVQVEGTVSKPSITVNDKSKDTFVKSLKAGEVDAATFTEGAFTPASIADGFFSAGSQASYAHTGFSGGDLGAATKGDVASEGIVAAIDAEDAEMLVFSAAATTNVVTEQGAFTKAVYGTDTFVANTLPSIDTTKFKGGSKAPDTFKANKLPEVDGTASAVTAVSAELAAAPVFTGKKYMINTTSDTALKEVAFTATNSAEIVTKAEYKKQVVDAKTFTPEDATLGFAGTEIANFQVTGVTYKKADADAAYSVEVTPEVDSMTRTAKTIEITVTPDVE